MPQTNRHSVRAPYAILAVLAGVLFLMPGACAVAQGLVPNRTLTTLTSARDPQNFALALAPVLTPISVPLTQREAVAAELTLRSRTLSQKQALATAQALCDEALAADFDPLLLLAVISVESGYNHLAISGVGAEGLMQLMPGTAAYLAARGKTPWPDKQSFDPVLNVTLGARYLAYLRDMFSGRVDLALTAYNRGPTATRLVMRKNQLPRNIRAAYAGRVMLAYQALRANYGHLPSA